MTAAAFWSLVRKDLRELGPLLLALLALMVVYMVDSAVFEAADDQACTVLEWMRGDPDATSAWIPLVFGFLAASMLLPAEHEQRTIDLLNALPVSRRAVFFTKVAVVAMVLLVFTVLDFLTTAAFCALNPDTQVRQDLEPRLMFTRLGLDAGLTLVGVAHGALLAFFRRLGWVILVAVLFALQAGKSLWPELAILNLTALHQVEHVGTRPLIPWRAWLLHAALGAAALALAHRLWLTRTERFALTYERLTNSAWLRRGALVGGLLMAVLVAVGLGTQSFDAGSAEDADDAESEQRTATLETRHFHFTYRVVDADRARFVATMADEAYQSVRQRLGATGAPTAKVVADLTQQSSDHAGLAGWQRMRMDIGARHSPAFLRHVLYHEVAHVVAGGLAPDAAEGGDDVRKNALRFFDEGLAEHLAFDLLSPAGDKARKHARLLAASWRRRFQIHLEALQDPATFTTRHSEVALYAFGELWVDALVRACGASMPGRLLRRLGDPTLPRSLQGLALWRVALQREGCSLEGARSHYEAELARLWPESRQLPLASARYRGREPDGSLRFKVTVEVAGGAIGDQRYPVMLLVRDGPHTPPHLVRRRKVELAANVPTEVTLRQPRIEGERFEHMVGAVPPGGDQEDLYPVFTRWQSNAVGN